MRCVQRQVGGQRALDLVKEEYDEKVSRIVGSWPAVFDISLAKKLGFGEDGSLEQTMREYVETLDLYGIILNPKKHWSRWNTRDQIRAWR